MSWASAVKNIRARHGMKQEVLAGYLGMDQATVSRWERGASAPTVAMQCSILGRMEALSGGDAASLNRVIESARLCPSPIGISAAGNVHETLFLNRAGMAMLYSTSSAVDWLRTPITAQQEQLYGAATNKSKLFDDRLIYKAEVALAVVIPSGGILFITCLFHPVWLDNNKSPNMICRLVTASPFAGESGSVSVHRHLESLEVINLGQ